jgi:hypothetical protein
MLLTVRLQLHEQHFLCKTVGRVSFLWVTVPEILLSEGHRRELRIRTDGTRANKLLDANEARGFDDMQTHYSVIVKETPRIGAVRAYTSDDRRKVDKNVRAGILIKAQGLSLFAQIVVTTARHRDFPATRCPKLFNNGRTQEAAAPANDYTPTAPKAHGSFSIAKPAR